MERYSVRPAESVSQIPALPFAVFKTNAGPVPSAFAAAADADAEVDAEVVVEAVVVEEAADGVPDELLHAAASVARAARERPKLSARGEVLRSMTILM
jgi:hypothetical protein